MRPKDLSWSGARATLDARGFGFVAALAVVGASIPRFWALFNDDSVYYPDEIFQTLEQAHRAAFGYGFIPWEFREAARSWLLPGVLAIVLKIGAAIGIASGIGLAHFAKGFMVLLSLACAYATVRLARDRGGLSAAILAGALYASLPPLVVFGARCMSETASLPAIGFASLWLLGNERGARRAVGAGALLGVAVFLRPQNGLAALSFLAVVLAQRRWRDARALVAGGAAAALLGGVLDWVTWGAPFRSLLVYLRFDLVEGKASLWGVSPWSLYFASLWTSCGPILVVLIAGLVVAARRNADLVVVPLVYVLVHSMVPHKQLRFISPLLPLALVAASVGMAAILRRREPGVASPPTEDDPPAIAFALVLAAVLAGSLGRKAARDTYADFGAPGRGKIWKDAEGATLLLAKAGMKTDLCGFMLEGIDRSYTGAYGYLHRDVPFFNDMGPAARQSSNYLVAPRTSEVPPSYASIAVNQGFALFKRPGECAPPPPGYTRETGDDPMKR